MSNLQLLKAQFLFGLAIESRKLKTVKDMDESKKVTSNNFHLPISSNLAQ
jgi:hypothetical protein